MSKTWKVIAIVFIILFILESILLFWIFKYSFEYLEKEDECAINICSDYESYSFNLDDICYCYHDGFIEHQEYIR